MLSLQRQMTAVLSNVQSGRTDMGDYILMWNMIFPIDRWWRTKHGIPFGSEAHRDSRFIDMLTEYKEDNLFDSIREPDKYVAGSGDIFRTVGNKKAEEDEYDDIFDKIKI